MKINRQFNEIPFPFAKVNLKGKIIAYNDSFEATILSAEKAEDEIKQLSDEIDFNKEKQNIILKNKAYSLSIKKNEDETYSLFFHTINENNETIVSLIFIDNYDEVLDGIEEFRHPLIIAIVDRKIKKMAKDLGGVLRQFEKDKYIFIFSKEKLEELKEAKFDILDSVREIDMGNTIPITLSIGIGISGINLDQNMEFARASIDLALSRGGDQVVIKDSQNYQFFGGHAKEVGRNSRVRARVKAYALSELIEGSSNVLVMGHKNIDLDCLGAAVGVYSIVNAFEKKCKIVMGNVTSSVSLLYDRLINDEKYSDAFISGEKALSLVNRRTLLIVVDNYKPSMCDEPELINKVNKVVVFDHHRKGVEYIEKAVLTYHEPYASSTCELVTEMLMYINQSISIKSIEADAILAGIIVDTKNFVFKTGIKTFEAAAFLKKKGSDSIRVKTLFKNSIEIYNAKAEIVKNHETFNKNMAISVLSREVDNPILVIAQASDDLLSIDGVSSSFVLYQNGDDVNISARSLGDINVQIIMEVLGGGGHQYISATRIKNTNIDEAKEMLKKAINEYLEQEE